VLTITGTTDKTPTLRLLVQDREKPKGRALPGGFVRERWTVAQTVADVLQRKVGIEPDPTRVPHLLRLFDDPNRDDRTWAMSVAHSLSLPESALLDARGDLVEIGHDGRLVGEGPLLFDHDQIVTAAVESLRNRYGFRIRGARTIPDPDGFLPEPFTIHQLRLVHEAVIGEALHRDTFRRRVEGYLEPVKVNGKALTSIESGGRPAALFRRERR